MPPVTPVKPKDWFSSRTIVFNLMSLLLTALVAVQTAIQGTSIVSEYPVFVLVLSALISVFNIILRKLTTQPLKWPSLLK